MIESLEARRLLSDTLFFGRVSAVFSKPTPKDSIYTGVGTPSFTYGQGDENGPSKLDWLGRAFHDKKIGEEFWMGTINYFNGTTYNASEGVRLLVTVKVNDPQVAAPLVFNIPLKLISTINDPNPLEPDYVKFGTPGEAA